MRAAVRTWGHSLALRIPRALAAQVNLSEGSEVELTLTDGKLVVLPVAGLEYELDDLLSGVTAENLHAESDTGEPVGREVW
jgi:antitoxin MazE